MQLPHGHYVGPVQALCQQPPACLPVFLPACLPCLLQVTEFLGCGARQFVFMLKGLRELQPKLEAAGIPFFLVMVRAVAIGSVRTVLWSKVQYSTVHSAVQCSVVQYITVCFGSSPSPVKTQVHGFCLVSSNRARTCNIDYCCHLNGAAPAAAAAAAAAAAVG